MESIAGIFLYMSITGAENFIAQKYDTKAVFEANEDM